MREIKFRFWDTQENGWMVDGREETNIYDFAFKKGMNWTFLTKEEALERIVVCQFINIHDKNGVEMYSGDVYDIGICTKVIRPEHFIEDTYELMKMLEDGATVEVIGNIYDNPSLVEVQP